MIGQVEAAGTELAAMTQAWRDLGARWDLNWRERRMLLPKGGEFSAQPCADTEARMRMHLEIGYRIRFEGDEELQEWLRHPTELFGWYSPLEVMGGTLGDLRRFRAFVEQGLGS